LPTVSAASSSGSHRSSSSLKTLEAGSDLGTGCITNSTAKESSIDEYPSVEGSISDPLCRRDTLFAI